MVLETKIKKFKRAPRELNTLGMIVYLIALTLLAVVALAADAALGSPATPAERTVEIEPTPARVETAIKALLKSVKSSDPRVLKAAKRAELIFNEAKHYNQDPFTVLASLFCESSLHSGIQADSEYQEWGMAQAHGLAKRKCQEEMKERGIDFESEQGQIGCGAFLLNYWEQDCDYLAQDLKQCKRYAKKCTGAVSAYITGDCNAAKLSKPIASKVSYRLRLAAKLDKLSR